MNLKVTISIDDVCPKPGYQIIDEPAEQWLRSLNEEFGAKFTLFIPSNFHDQYPISQHKSWINKLKSIEYFEIASHGHFHQTSNPSRFGECEFFELNTFDDVVERARLMFHEWNDVGILPTGWRSPGWLTSQATAAIIPTQFDYAAVHCEHSKEVRWGRTNFKLFTGHDNINAEHISVHNGDMIMFQSHIAGKHNLNMWTQESYEQLRISLQHLVENNNCQFKTLKECL